MVNANPVSSAANNPSNLNSALGAKVNAPQGTSAGASPLPPTPQSPAAPTKLNKQTNWKVILGGLALVLLLVGGGSAFYLSRQQQDIRQQAATGCSVTCANGESFTDDPQTFATCDDWAREACAPRGGIAGGTPVAQPPSPQQPPSDPGSVTDCVNWCAGCEGFCGDAGVAQGKTCNEQQEERCGEQPCYVTGTCTGGCVPDAAGFACNGTTKSTCNADGTYVTVQTNSDYCGGAAPGDTTPTDPDPSPTSSPGTGGSTNKPNGSCVSVASECASENASYSSTCLNANRSTPQICESATSPGIGEGVCCRDEGGVNGPVGSTYTLTTNQCFPGDTKLSISECSETPTATCPSGSSAGPADNTCQCVSTGGSLRIFAADSALPGECSVGITCPANSEIRSSALDCTRFCTSSCIDATDGLARCCPSGTGGTTPETPTTPVTPGDGVGSCDVWCATWDCPSGDTNGDNQCTYADANASYLTRTGRNCPEPASGCGQRDYYNAGPEGINWDAYCEHDFLNFDGCDPSKTPPPEDVKYECNSPCQTDAQCQDTSKGGNAGFSCVSNQCRLTTNPSSAQCRPAVGPQCLDITLNNVSSPGLPPAMGENVNFTCGLVAAADHYVFRLAVPGAADVLPLAAASAGSNISQNYTINASGEYLAQCQICTTADPSSCMPWEPLTTTTN